MKQHIRCRALIIIGLACLMSCHSDSGIQAELEMGIVAYNNGSSEVAIQHLRRAVALGPRLVNGHYYLALSYDAMYAPAAEPGDQNWYWSSLAIEEYKTVLRLDPSHKEATKRLAYLLFNLDRIDESEQYYRMAMDRDANDPEPMYMTAVMDWRRSYAARALKRAELHLPRRTSLIGSGGCEEIRSRNLPRIEEGIRLMMKVVNLSNNADAIDFLGFLYQERADIQCGSHAAYAADLKTADQWADRSCATRRHSPGSVSPPRWWPPPPPPPARADCFEQSALMHDQARGVPKHGTLMLPAAPK